jgi:hypothetical protein
MDYIDPKKAILVYTNLIDMKTKKPILTTTVNTQTTPPVQLFTRSIMRWEPQRLKRDLPWFMICEMMEKNRQ